ncbi:MAG: peptidylprolyl isomerase [Lysobacterales bacterium]
MIRRHLPLLALGLIAQAHSLDAPPIDAGRPPTASTAELIGSSQPSDWRRLDPAETLYLELAQGRVVIELAPAFAPRHVANLKTLVKAGYFDGLAILRVQDNYVVQWGDPAAGEAGKARSLGLAKARLPPEFSVGYDADWPFTRLPDGDVYAAEVGFSNGFPAARSASENQTWLTHCYAALGVGRDDAVDSGSGAELYVVIGHAPRHLDRNVTVLGRVWSGMELLSALPRGSGPMGFYQQASQRISIKRLRLASGLPPTEQTPLEVMRTDRPLWQALVESRRNRHEPWFSRSAGRVDLCNIPIPVRVIPNLAGLSSE